jgi:hypothetical protein
MYNLYSFKTRKGMFRACSTHGRDEKTLIGKAEETMPPGRHRCRREDHIKIDLNVWYVRVWTALF